MRARCWAPWWGMSLAVGLQVGCAGPSSHEVTSSRTDPLAARGPGTPPAVSRPPASADALVRVAAAASPQADASPSAPFEGQAELRVEALVEAVLARNPTLAQMVAAWQAASARYPQVTSLDDPQFGAFMGPASVGSKDVDFAYRLEVSQKVPWRGKLALRGENALAEARAAENDVQDARLQLVESARAAFADYYLVGRALAVNEEAQQLLAEFRENAQARYRTGQAPQQDVLQADVEIGRQRERQLTLERMKQVAIARLNTLMHLPTGSPLPPPPNEIGPSAGLPDVRELQAQALARRPDLRALADRALAEEASLRLAQKEYYPDLDLMAAHDAFWQRPEEDLRPQIGVRLNLPVRTARRHAAVAEAQARVAQRQAELARQTDQVNLQVEEAYHLVRESEKALRLYDDTILPAARENVKAAIAAYTTGRVPFLSLLEAQRNLITLRERSYETTTDVFRRRATLERVVGGPLAPALPAQPHE